MREHLEFLMTSSAVVKIAAWIFLFFGLVGGAGILLGRVSGKSTLDGILVVVVFTFLFFFFYLIAKIADLLIRMIHEIHQLKKE